MKKSVAALIIMFMIALSLPAFAESSSANAPVSAASQTRHYRHHKRSFWKKHRDKLTVAGGTLGGAAIGGLAGGKKGAAIGAIAGGGGSAAYTYKLRKRRHHRRP